MLTPSGLYFGYGSFDALVKTQWGNHFSTSGKVDAKPDTIDTATKLISEASRPRLVFWLPVVDEVRTTVCCLSRENMIPNVPKIAEMTFP